MFVDLTRIIDVGTPVYPGDPLFQSRTTANHELDGYRVSCWTIGSHLGTHLDAPFHQFVDGERLDDLPLDFFVGQAAVIDLSSSVARFESRRRNRPFPIEPELLEPFELVFEKVPRILLKTGWENRSSSAEYYRNFPSLSPRTAEWLADFPIRILGLETPSLSALSLSEDDDRFDDDEIGERRENEASSDEFDSEVAASRSEKTVSATKKLLSIGERTVFDEATLHADQECHRILLGRRPPILPLEGIVRLESLPSFVCPELERIDFAAASPFSGLSELKRSVAFDESNVFALYCFPLKIANADGSPVRAVAEIPD